MSLVVFMKVSKAWFLSISLPNWLSPECFFFLHLFLNCFLDSSFFLLFHAILLTSSKGFLDFLSLFSYISCFLVPQIFYLVCHCFSQIGGCLSSRKGIGQPPESNNLQSVDEFYQPLSFTFYSFWRLLSIEFLWPTLERSSFLGHSFSYVLTFVEISFLFPFLFSFFSFLQAFS